MSIWNYIKKAKSKFLKNKIKILCLVRKKKKWFIKKFTFKNHVLKMKFKASFSTFDKKYSKTMGYQTDQNPNPWQTSEQDLIKFALYKEMGLSPIFTSSDN